MNTHVITPIKIGNVLINIIDLYSLTSSNALTFDAHDHEFFEIHIVLDGSAQIKIRDEFYDLQKNKIVIIPPNFTHNAVLKSSDYRSCVLGFEFKPIDETTKRKYECGYFCKLFKNDQLFFLETTAYERFVIAQLLKNSNKFTIYNVNKSNVEVSNLFLEFANKLDSLNTTKNKNKETTFIPSNETSTRKYKIELFLQSKFTNGQEVSLSELAKHLFLSPRQTERFIKATFGLTFKQLSTKYRMMIAKNLIEQSDLSIEEIAYKIGYSSYNGFLSAYKKKYGISPAKHKK